MSKYDVCIDQILDTEINNIIAVKKSLNRDTMERVIDLLLRVKPAGRKWDCVFASEHLYAGFPHFHFLANIQFAENFYEAALKNDKRVSREAL